MVGGNSRPSFTCVLVLSVFLLAAQRGFSQECLEPPADLRAWWSGDDHPRDSTGGSSGTLVGGASYDLGHVGYGFRSFGFGGGRLGGGYVNLGHSAAIDIAGDLTVELWFKLHSQKYNVLAEKGLAVGGGRGWWVRQRGDTTRKLEFQLLDAEGDYMFVESDSVVGTGEWHHVALVREGSSGRLYLDGVVVASGNNPALGDIRTTFPVFAGADPRFDYQPFADATIDEISIYARALTVAEIQAVVAASHCGKCKPLPIVPGLTAEVYACVPACEKLSFDPETGALYVGNGESGPSGLDPVRIHRVGPGGQPVETYGPGIIDPDSVLFDATGSVSGVPGSVLVGVGDTLTTGQILAIRPDQSLATVFPPSTATLNPSDMKFDRDGRLVMINHSRFGVDVGDVFVLSGGSLQLHYTVSGSANGISVDVFNRYYTSGATNGIVGLHGSDGTVINSRFADNLGTTLIPIEAGPGSATWGSDLYTARVSTGELLRIDATGTRFTLGTGFGSVLTDLEFGPDDALYVSSYSEGRILRISGAAADTTPPAVSILIPAEGAIFGTNLVALRAAIADASKITVSSIPDGINVSLPAGGGTVEGTLELLYEGANLLSVSATDAFGNTGGTSIKVVRDTLAPVITVLSPPASSVLGDSPVSVQVEVEDATATTVFIAGQEFSVPALGGQFTAVVDLASGVNVIDLVAVDAANNQSLVKHAVSLDLDAPIVKIDSPSNGACFGPGDSPVAVVATVNDLSATVVTSTPSGVEGSLSAGGGLVTGAVALAEGSNTVTVGAKDAVGRAGSASIAVVYDTTAPKLVLDSPLDGSAVSGTIDLHATASDPSPGSGVQQVELSVDDSLPKALPAEPFEIVFDTTTLIDGPHSFLAAAIDHKGNRSTVSAKVLVDNTAPVIKILSPVSNAVVGGALAFEVSAFDAGSGLLGVALSAGGMPADGSIKYEVPVYSDLRTGIVDTTGFLDGEMTLTASGVDWAGNVSITSIQVVVDNTAPEKTILKPSEGEIVSGTLLIVASAVDSNLDTLEIQVDKASLGVSSNTEFSASFDTTTRLDGDLVVTVIARDLAGNATSCSIIVVVDNLSISVRPRTLNLKSKSGENRVSVLVEGVNVAQLVPPELHGLELRVAGGSPVPVIPGYGQIGDEDGDGVPDTIIKFDRQALIGSIRAGIANGKIDPNKNVVITLVAAGGALIGDDSIKVVGY